MSKDLIQRLSHAYISTSGELYDEAAEAIEQLVKERDEALRQLRYVLQTNDDAEAREFLAYIDAAALRAPTAT